jgi:hypothetical protein
MDPTTLAAKHFLAQLESFWNPPPTAPTPPGPRIVRVVADPSERGDLVRSLRWLEWSPESRRPVVLFEDALEDEHRWLRALVTKTADDCEAVQEGLAADGLLVTPLPARPAATTIAAPAARRYLDAVAEHLAGGPLDGLVIALVPTYVADPAAYRGTLAKIAAPPIGASLRLAVLDVSGADLAALLPSEARFELDRDELFTFLKQMSPKRSKGPAAEPLRVLLLDAGQALSEGKAQLAVQHLLAAQALCRTAGLRAQECATEIPGIERHPDTCASPGQ